MNRKEIKERVLEGLPYAKRWCSVFEMAEAYKRITRCTESPAYKWAKKVIRELSARRIRVGYRWWFTTASSPVSPVDLCGYEEWLSIPEDWRLEHSIERISDQDDYNHAMLLGALAYGGDEVAMNSFESLRDMYAPPEEETVRGRGNVGDLMTLGEKEAKRWENKDGR